MPIVEEIERRTGRTISRAAVYVTLVRLEKRGLVSRTRSTTSQREVLIGLTPTGEAVFSRSFRHLHATHKAYFDAKITASEQRTLAKLLTKLTTA